MLRWMTIKAALKSKLSLIKPAYQNSHIPLDFLTISTPSGIVKTGNFQ